MPGMKDEITIWENGTKKREKNYYFIMFLRKAYKIYIELPVSDKVKFSKFWNFLNFAFYDLILLWVTFVSNSNEIECALWSRQNVMHFITALT